MSDLDELVRALELQGSTVLVRGRLEVTSLRIAESFDAPLDDVRGAGLIATRQASSSLIDYRLDMALRQAADTGVALLGLHGPVALSSTALRIAGRQGITVCELAAETDLAALLLILSRTLASSQRDGLERLVAAHAAILRAQGESETAVLEAGARTLGTAFTVWPSLAGGPNADDLVVTPERVGPVEEIAAALIGRAILAVQHRRRRESRVAARARGQLLAELLAASSEQVHALADRARALDVPTEGWFQVGRLHVDAADGAVDAVTAFRHAEELLAAALDLEEEGRQLSALSGTSLCIALPAGTADSAATGRLRALIASVIKAAPVRLDGRRVVAGIGAPHRGLDGVRASAAEAESALRTARASARTDGIAVFDASGVGRMLADWLASESARRSVSELLAGLDGQRPARRAELVRTLHTYLDEQGSIQRSAVVLHLHPNAVRYRIRKIREMLDSDLSDPDERLALQIACRARLASTASAT